ncbi:MAG: sigma-70 family RNA polymerase sigma factor [Actinomycetota bacterium]|nr:sigma-70 family RNA polymerase sigma factor [Actinomycetota bacterium]
MSTATDPQVNTPYFKRNPSRVARARRSDEVVRRLVHGAAAGDQRAWDELVEEFGGLVWSIARAHGLNDADAADVSQVTWLRLVEHLDRLHDPARVGAWLATTARRQCLQVCRTAAPIPAGDDLPDQVSDAPAPGATLLARERDLALTSALARLPVRDRRLLRMLAADPAPSYAEVSAALGMPHGSIGPTRARALERLRREARREGLSAPEW